MQAVAELPVAKKVEPRDYQQRIVSKTVRGFNGEFVNGAGKTLPRLPSILIESPTGSGKTIMGLTAAKDMQEINPDMVVVWVAMRRFLLHQAEKANREMGINVQNIHFTSMFDTHLTKILEAKAAGKQIMLVMDEAQHDAATSMSTMHNVIKPDQILGLTATPFRTDSLKLCFSLVIKDAGIHRLISDGYLSKFDHYTLDDWDVETVADAYAADPERWGKSAFYFVDLAKCWAMQDALAKRGIKNDVVTGDSDWETQIERFEAGEHNCLINCMKLTEGFDCPALQSVWVRDSSKGPTIQMAGRVLRKYPGLDVKNIIQSFRTKHPFTATAVANRQFKWSDGRWLGLQLNEKTDLIAQNTLTTIANTDTRMPQFFAKDKPKKKRPW